MFSPLNQVLHASTKFDVATPEDSEGIPNYRYLTSDGGQAKSANVSRPMFWFEDVDGACPALLFHSNPFQKDKAINPWHDVILQEDGIAFYNGDNKHPGRRPGANPPGGSQSGNNKVEGLVDLYKSHRREDRIKAPPILLFEQVKHRSRPKGYRAFRGCCILTGTHIRQQYEEGTDRVFSNYVFELALVRLPHEGLDWKWISDRRDPSLRFDDRLRNAPHTWRIWVNEGESAIGRIRQKITGYAIGTPLEQLAELLPEHNELLDTIIDHYKPSRKESKFEALASLATQEFFGEALFDRGWITPQSGDMGVDFIGRYDLKHPEVASPPGSILGGTSLLIIGQAKCRLMYKEEAARDIARVASRLQRGHVGVYVTTGVFKEWAQREVAIDDYPIILINGRHLADLLLAYMGRTGKSILDVLAEQDRWYDENISYAPPATILHAQIPR